jgi:hypothetical protein
MTVSHDCSLLDGSADAELLSSPEDLEHVKPRRDSSLLPEPDPPDPAYC